MHVLLLTINYPNSYNEQSHVFFREQAEALQKAGVNIGVVSPISVSLLTAIKKVKFDFGLKVYELNGVKTMLYQYPAIPKWYWLNFKLKKYVGKRLLIKYMNKHGKPDLIHNHVSLVGESAVWAKRKYGIPYVVTEHYSIFLQKNIVFWRKRIAKHVFEKSNKNIAVSNFLVERLIKIFNKNFIYIPNLIDTEFFKPLKKPINKETVKYFLNIGNLKKGKNQLMLIEAFTKSFKNNKQYKLIIVGSGVEYDRLKSKISELDMHNQITLFGQASREEVLDLMQKSTYFVLSSLFETFGVVLIEAMACGLPIISTTCGGPQSILINNKLGVLCDIETNSLALAMLTASNKTYNSEYIRSYAVDYFSGKVLSNQLIKIYKSEIIH